MKNKEAKSIFSSLENFSSIPPPELWDKIEAQLDQPKKKKRAIIWWSVAASLVVGLSVPTILYFNSNQRNGVELNLENNADEVVLQKDSDTINNERSVVNGNNDINRKEEDNNAKLNRNRINLNNNNQVVLTKISPFSFKKKGSKGVENLNQQNNGLNKSFVKEEPKSNEIVANQKLTNSNTNKKSAESSENNSISVSNANKAIAANEISKSELAIDKSVQIHNSSTNKKSAESSENNSISVSNANKAIAVNEISKSESVIDKSVQVYNSSTNKKSAESSGNNSIPVPNTNKAIAANKISKPESVIDKFVQVGYSNTDDKVVVGDKNANISKSNTNKTIVESTSSKDSLSKIKSEVAQLENALAKLEQDKTKKKEVSESIDKWSLQVFAGVMSSENYNNEKALGNTVASKQSSGYGVKTNYKLNKKWGVSSGFKINELGQKIAGVTYYDKQSFSGSVMGILPTVNDNYVPNSSSSYELVSISKNEEYLFSSNAKSENGFEEGDVTQNLKYFEIPLEISYALFSKNKTNITMNTGGFVGRLISNDISLNGNSIGENKNVNEYVYGTLLSSTLQYEIFKKTKFFIEPGMNYYINPLENQSFNQFQWMFNVGLHFDF